MNLIDRKSNSGHRATLLSTRRLTRTIGLAFVVSFYGSASIFSQNLQQDEVNAKALQVLQEVNQKIANTRTYSADFELVVGKSGFITQGHIYQENNPDGTVEINNDIENISANNGKSFLENKMVVIKNKEAYYTLAKGVAIRMNYMKTMSQQQAQLLAGAANVAMTNNDRFSIYYTNLNGEDCFVINEDVSKQTNQILKAISKAYTVGVKSLNLYECNTYADNEITSTLRFTQLRFDSALHEEYFAVPRGYKIINADTINDYRLALATGEANTSRSSKNYVMAVSFFLLTLSTTGLIITLYLFGCFKKS